MISPELRAHRAIEEMKADMEKETLEKILSDKEPSKKDQAVEAFAEESREELRQQLETAYDEVANDIMINAGLSTEAEPGKSLMKALEASKADNITATIKRMDAASVPYGDAEKAKATLYEVLQSGKAN